MAKRADEFFELSSRYESPVASLSAEEVFSLVALIYKGPTEQTPWLSFLEELGAKVNCLSAGIVLRLSREGQPPIISWGRCPLLPLDRRTRIHAAHSRLGDKDPLRNSLNTPGAILTLDEVITSDELHESEFYREVMQPFGYEHAIGMYISEPNGWECNVGLTNDAARGNFTDAHRALLETLRPHLEQSLAIYSQMQCYKSELDAVIDTLDRLTISTVILSGAGKVLRCNRAARKLAATGPVRIVHNRLALDSQAESKSLADLVNQAISASRTRGGSSFAQGMRISSDSHSHLGVLVRAIGRDSPFTNDANPAVIIHFSGSSIEQPIEQLVAKIFDLTPSEAQLATLLAEGYTLVQAAEKLGLKESSVRSYCKMILAKVGVCRQVDLVRLILRSVAILG